MSLLKSNVESPKSNVESQIAESGQTLDFPTFGIEASQGRAYWRSLEELARTPQFNEMVHREFPEGASEMMSPFTRRTFLSLMAASIALAGGLSGCRRPERLALPYSRLPENLIEGVPQQYATACERGGRAVGLIAKCFEGRPVKLEGNPDHPASLGATDAATQGLILELYDPDRSRSVTHAGQATTVEALNEYLRQSFDRHRANQGAGLRILSEATGSPTTLAARDRLLAALPRARWHVWEPVNEDAAIEATRRLYGAPLMTHYDFERADAIVALEADIFCATVDAVRQARQFARRRRPAGASRPMNRLYAVEGVYTLTGAAADHRLRVNPSQAPHWALGLLAELSRTHGAVLPAVPGGIEPIGDAAWIKAVANDLREHVGTSLVVAGPGQPVELHMLAHAINRIFGHACMRYTTPPDAGYGTALGSIAELVEAMKRGEVTTLAMIGGNPVYDAPADLDFAQAMRRVADTIHLSHYFNETSAAATWHAPRAHALESWGDARAADGTVSIVQPLIAPLFGGLTDPEFLARLGGDRSANAYDLVYLHHTGSSGENLNQTQWRRALHDGWIDGTAAPDLAPGLAPNGRELTNALATLAEAAPASEAGTMELVFQPDHNLHDGRYANNGWLQETPDPVTKLTWDNAALLSPATAARLGLGDVTAIERRRHDQVRVELDGRAVTLPAWIVPGMADDVVALALGYGRTHAGHVGNGVGVNVYPLRTSQRLHVARGAKVTHAGAAPHELATTQHHWAMEGRAIVQEATLDDYRAHPGFAREAAGDARGEQLWESPADYSQGPQWGMSVDLNACIGCNACMVACQAENNIPIVGREQVFRGREMNWIRVDRYFSGTAEKPRMVFQPVMCQQCENAPCEQVCPVAATSHSPDGLNQMAYNRCIGTRYCSNNCPFKVRRFNFLNYHMEFFGRNPNDVEKMGMNPDVTVRMRGVMEKCSFCVQRIHRVQREAKVAGQPVATDSIQTACQQVCPTEAIVFGDIRDAKSRVAALKAEPRDYSLLGLINVRPRTSYMARIRNPNPALET